MPAKILSFYFKQVLLLGTIGYGMFIAPEWWTFGPFLAADELQTWLFALALVATFLVAFATPLQLACRALRLEKPALFVGFVSGPLAVVFVLFFFTHYSFTVRDYISRAMVLHIIFAVVGLCFAFNFQRWLGHNFRSDTHSNVRFSPPRFEK
jgi:hypothetical protein